MIMYSACSWSSKLQDRKRSYSCNGTIRVGYRPWIRVPFSAAKIPIQLARLKGFVPRTGDKAHAKHRDLLSSITFTCIALRPSRCFIVSLVLAISKQATLYPISGYFDLATISSRSAERPCSGSRRGCTRLAGLRRTVRLGQQVARSLSDHLKANSRSHTSSRSVYQHSHGIF
jgi:hypothetical protein